MRKLLFAVCLSVIPAMAADLYTFTVPAGENVSGPAGLTLTGWVIRSTTKAARCGLFRPDLGLAPFFTPRLTCCLIFRM